MFDTIKLRIPIDELQYKFLLSICCSTKKENNFNQKIIFHYDSFEIIPSYNYEINISINGPESITKYKDNKMPYYLGVQFSGPKIILGHNLFNMKYTLNFYIDMIIKIIKDNTQDLQINKSEILIDRLDIAFNYDLKNQQNIKDYIDSISRVYYARRKLNIYDSSIYIAGTTTTLKMYNKYLEFKKHDYKKLKKHFEKMRDTYYNKDDTLYSNSNINLETLNNLLQYSKRILRVEVEIKKKKLKDLYIDLPKINQIDTNILIQIYDNEIKKIFNIGDNDNMYNKSIEVQRVLNNNYNNNLANILKNTWYNLSIHGTEYTKNIINPETLRRHKRLLKDVGIVWTQTDVKLENKNIINLNFIPKSNSEFILPNEETNNQYLFMAM